MKLKLQFIIAAIIVLAIYIPVVNGQANLTFSGANGTPLTITLQQSVTYTINNLNCTSGPIFVFDGAGSFPSVGGDQIVNGTLSFSINGGSAQLINRTGSSSSAGVLTSNDIYAFRNPLVPLSNGNVVVLNAGSYTTANNISGPPPANGSFPTFITNAGLDAVCSPNGVSSLPPTAPFDFDGDNKSDFSIFRPSSGEWWYLRSSDGGNNAFQFGTATDVMTPGDYTGDGKWDFAFYRPSNGTWYILRSEDGSYYAFPFGIGTDIPVPADYDNDGKTDAAVYRPSETKWYILKSTGGVDQIVFGEPGSKPVPADYMGNSAVELSYYNPITGFWRIKHGNEVVSMNFQPNANNKPVPANLAGDKKAEMTVFNQGGWTFAVNGGVLFTQFGIAGDIPVPADYDGDGFTDYAIYRPSTATWWYMASSVGLQHRAVQFGNSTDKPVPSAFVR